MDDDDYGMTPTAINNYMSSRPVFTPPPEIISNHRGLPATHHYDNMVMMSHGLHHDMHSHSTTNNAVPGVGAASFSAVDIDAAGLGGDTGTGRWPRQETLSLLEIRSRLDAKFKEANQKGPLWDEVSRIMYEEHGYQRSGKKCREKFENLYKYYKKTKEGKAGRQDGKHYRFFRQLDALYGETTTTTNYPPSSTSDPHLPGTTAFRYNEGVVNISNTNQELFNHHHHQCTKQSEETSLRLSNSSDFETTSSEDSERDHNNENSSSGGKRKKRSKRGWKTKIKEFIDAQMMKLMVTQDAWLEKMMKTIEHKEQERMMREETWKKQEEERIEKEHRFWDKKRALIEAKDRALMETLHKLAGKEIVSNDNASESITNLARGGGDSSWQECEITRLIQLRSLMEARFVEQVGCGEIIWEEISAKMASFGYDKSALTCKNKWESINDYLIKCQKREKESSASCGYFQGNHHSICQQQQYTRSSRGGISDHAGGNSPPNCTTGLNISDNCFRYFMGNADNNNFWENYGVKLCKGDNDDN